MTLPNAACSACIEMLFTAETPDYAQRIHLAARAGFAAVEFWGWRGKDLGAIDAAVQQTGLRVVGFVAEGVTALTDPATHEAFLAALPASIATAQRLGAPFLYIQAGRNTPTHGRATQTVTLIHALTRAADLLQGSGVTLLLEPVSDAKDGFLSRAADGLPIVAAVDRPEIRLLYDLYHAAMAGEATAPTIGANIDLIGHVHVADHPGRGAPGTGTLDLDRDIAWIRAQGYDGLFGLEYVPATRA
ncbi:MAG: TIM barrel protein [bacterium]